VINNRRIIDGTYFNILLKSSNVSIITLNEKIFPDSLMLLKILLHTLVIILLTLITQVGGIIYLLVLLLLRRPMQHRRIKRIGTFILLYALATFLIIPYTAPFFGREKIIDSENVIAHSFIYKLANRNYVKPQLNTTLQEVGQSFGGQNKGIKLVYLDANFPFIDGFPLLPHLSHNDGKKVDVSFIYEDSQGKIVNLKPSVSGYGVFEAPLSNEYDQINACKNQGYWQYDYSQYLTFGTFNAELKFSKNGTKSLMNAIISQPNIKKIFIEPHLKSRLGLKQGKIRFHGCQAVRHDDHIHFQL